MRCTSFIALAATVSVASAASTYEKRNNVDRPDPTNLDHCPGRPTGDADACTFEQSGTLPDVRVWNQVGAPVANCDSPGAPPIMTTVGGSTTVTETWTHTDSASIDLFGIKIGGSGGWSEASAQTTSQTITVTIPAGQQAVVVAGVNNHQSSGRIRLNYGDPSGDPGANDYHYIWYNNDVVSTQPTSDIEYDSKFIACGATFDPSSM